MTKFSYVVPNHTGSYQMSIFVQLSRWIDGEHDVPLGSTSMLGPIIGKTPDVDNDGIVLKENTGFG